MNHLTINFPKTIRGKSLFGSLSSIRRGFSTGSTNHSNDRFKFKIVDSTLREGEQFYSAFFNTENRIHIAKELDRIGVDYIEVITPMASKQSEADCRLLANLGLKAKILTHTRCNMEDVKKAIETGVNGVNVYMATSSILSKYSHGKGIDKIIEIATEVVQYAQRHDVEIRFSCEDTFRSDMSDLLKIYSEMEKLGVDRVGLADTVGISTPIQVYETVKKVREKVTCDIEFHVHNDTGCAVANSLVAIEAGVTHIDTCILGIGERNGITPLGAFLGRMYTLDRERVKAKYDLPLVQELEKYVAETVEIDIPFNNCITGSSAFAHKAGVHTKAVMQNASAYEVINPIDFGVERKVQLASKLTGWNAIQGRALQLGLQLEETIIKEVTNIVKNLADSKNVSIKDVDGLLYQANLKSSTPKMYAMH